jgi:hypothetical protein
MANETTSSTLSELYTNITQEAIFTFQETSVMRPLVTLYPLMGSGKVAEVPVYPAISAAAVNEATDLSNTAVNPTSATITASEIGVMTTLTDLGANSASRNVGADIGKLFGEAIAKKVDTDLCGLFSSFTTNTGGAAGTELTADLLFKAQAQLRTLSVPAPYYAVFHPKALFNLKKTLTQAGYSGTATAISELGNEALRNGYIGRIAGIDVFENANLAIDGSDDIRKHWDITLPLMKPYLALVAVISAISATKVFEEVYIMTQGGPLNSSKTIVYYLYEQAFGNLEISYACTIGLVLFLIILGLSILRLVVNQDGNDFSV